VQGVIKSYDPGTQTGSLLRDTDLAEIDLGDHGRAVRLRLGSEVDMKTPGYGDSPAG
jgi:hypothetical protein